MLPLWTVVFEKQLWETPGKIKIPFQDDFLIFFYISVAMTAGFVFRKLSPKFYKCFWLYLPCFTILTLAYTLIVEIYKNHFIFHLVTRRIFMASFLLILSGFIISSITGFLCRLAPQRILVLIMDSGTHTTYFTALLLENSLTQPDADIAKTAPVLCSLLSLIPAIILVLLFRIYKRYTGKDFADVIYSTGSGEDTECLSGEVVNEKETCI